MNGQSGPRGLGEGLKVEGYPDEEAAQRMFELGGGGV